MTAYGSNNTSGPIAVATCRNAHGSWRYAFDSETFLVSSGTVRRLTPLECERLQGFPDDWTRFDAAGREMPDAARYRQTGNAVCVPVAAWLGQRLAAAKETS